MSKSTSAKSTKSEAVIPAHAMPAGGSMDIPMGLLIVENGFNIRQTSEEDPAVKELAESLKKEGQIQEIIVEPNGSGKYVLRAGHRRLAAAKLLGWETLRAKLWVPTGKDGKSAATDPREAQLDRLFLNTAENVQRANVTPYDVAMRCKVFKREFGLKGDHIAKRLGMNTGYINNLLAIVGESEKGEHAGGTLHPDIMKQWIMECSWPADDQRTKICKINDLRRWVRMKHEDQLAEFNEELYVASGKGDREKYRAEQKALREAAGGGSGTTSANTSTNPKDETTVRASLGNLKAALDAAERERAAVPKDDKGRKEKIARLNGVIEGLKFAIGVKSGLTNRIVGVCAFKDGTMTEGMPPKEEKEEKGKGKAA